MKRAIVFWMVLVVGGCTKRNPAFCCITDAQCESRGLAELYPCEGSLVCDPTGTCVEPECASSADCTDPALPVCIDQLCVAACQQDEQCVGLEGRPFCAADGACVECLSDQACNADHPVCDAAHECRGCATDSECPSNVCIEANGTCAAVSDVIFVSQSGEDAGTCTKEAPCVTLTYALTKRGAPRTVIHIVGGDLQTGTGTVAITGPVTIDGTGTRVIGPAQIPTFAVAGGPVIIENLALKSTTEGPAITVTNSSALRLFNTTVQREVEVTNASLSAERSTFVRQGSLNFAITCSGGVVLVDQSRFENTSASTMNCQLTVRRSWFEEEGDHSINARGGLVLVENNVLVVSYEYADSASVLTALPGSTVRFNTFVNTTSLPASGVALACDSSVVVTSNVFAYRSTNPVETYGSCQPRYSLFDEYLPQPSGVGNKSTDGATIFVNRNAKDFHLASDSAARAAGEPELGVATDYDGAARPQPAGSGPDIGAFEAP